MDIQILMFVLVWTGILKEETSGKIKFYKMKAQSLYDKDTVFKDKVTNLISTSPDFNALLGKVSASHKDLIDYMDRGTE